MNRIAMFVLMHALVLALAGCSGASQAVAPAQDTPPAATAAPAPGSRIHVVETLGDGNIRHVQCPPK